MGATSIKSFVIGGHKSRTLKSLWVILLGFILITGTQALPAVESKATKKVTPVDKQAVIQKMFKLQMPFIANQGQIQNKHVKFHARTFGGTAFVTDQGEIVYSFSSVDPQKKGAKGLSKSKEAKGWILKEKLLGATFKVPQGLDRSQTKVNYFIGNDPGKWKTSIPTYNAVSLGDVYKGIQFSLKAYGNTIEKIFTIQPGADPNAITIELEGADSIKIDDDGQLEINDGFGMVRLSKPIAYQEKDGKREEIEANYRLEKNLYGFRVQQYDKSLPLIIDPVLGYSTYLGGGSEDIGYGIAVDGTGNAYVTGFTTSTDGDYDAFVTKLSDDGSSLIYSTYLAGSSDEWGRGIAVDGTGNAYVFGATLSDDFPTQDPIQSNNAGDYDAFVAKLSANGTLIYSTYLGGLALDWGDDIAVDGTGNAYVTGFTNSTNFPTTAGVIQATKAGVQDAFVAKLIADGSSLAYSTYLGGTLNDWGTGIAVDGTGIAYVTGISSSADFPTLNPIQATKTGLEDAYVAKLSANGTSLIYSTYLGGSLDDKGQGIAVDGTGIAYVTGLTNSTNFPTTTNAFQEETLGVHDAFVAKIDTNLSGDNSLIYSTYLGGSSDEWGWGIAVDGAGNAYVTGFTRSADFPTTVGAIKDLYEGNDDAFVAKLSDDGTSLIYSTYLGAVRWTAAWKLPWTELATLM